MAEEKQELVLKKQEISNLPLDNPIKFNKIKYTMLDEVKILMLENNLHPDKFLIELYEKDKMSYDDYWHLREWFFARPLMCSDEENDKAWADFFERGRKNAGK